MDNDNKIQTRKKFIFLGISAAALFTVFRFFIPRKKKKAETIKMLTQDGKLMEIDKDMIPGSKRKITDPELKAWVKNKTTKK